MMTEQESSIFLKLVVAQMALDGVSSATIRFFVKAFPALRRGPMTSLKMSESAIVTRGHARWQASQLEKAGYFRRCTRETWGISESPIKDRDLRLIMRKMGLETSESQNGSGKSPNGFVVPIPVGGVPSRM